VCPPPYFGAIALLTAADRTVAGAHETMLWIFGLVGGGLLVTSIVEYVARYVLRPN
jgi:hypothetical protein